MKRIPGHIGVVLVDHGSKLEAANAMLREVAELYRRATGTAVVEPAHMELAEPSIAQAFRRCVEQGATEVVIQPYFLSPGRHSTHDIPRLAAEAAREFPGVGYRVAEPLGVDERMAEIVHRRVLESLDMEEK